MSRFLYASVVFTIFCAAFAPSALADETLDQVAADFPYVAAAIEEIEEGTHDAVDVSAGFTGAVVIDASALSTDVPETAMWRSADGPESIVTPSASNEWMVFTWKDGTTLRIRLRGLDGSGEAADVSGAATMISDPGAAIDHAIYAASESMVEEFLVIDPDHVANADSRTFVWDIVGLPADWKVSDTGGGIITLFDSATDEQKMSISAPVVQDEAGKQLMSSFDLEDRNTFSLSIDTDLAEGRILADPVFFMTSVGYMQQNFCKGGISSCSVPSDASQPNLSGNAVGAYYTSASSYAYGPSVIATSTAVPVSAISRMIYTPPFGLKLYSLNIQSGNVRTGASRFACGLQGQKAGSWGYVAGSFVTYSGSTQNNFYNRSLVHNQIFNGNYLDAAAVTMINNTGAAANGGSAHRCTLETGGVMYAALYDTDNPNQLAAPDAGYGASFSQGTWYGPNKPSPSFLAYVSDYGSGVSTLQPVFTYHGGPNSGENVTYPSLGGQPHYAFPFCRGVNIGPNHDDVRPCYTNPTPTPIGIGLSPNLQNTSASPYRINLFRWKITDFTGREYFAPQVELKWDSVSPTKPFLVSDGTGTDIDGVPSGGTMSAKWSAASDAGSGINHYNYCWSAAVTWANGVATGCTGTLLASGTTTSLSVTRTGLSPASNTLYYFCVQPVDRANNASATATCSDGSSVVTSVPGVTGLIDMNTTDVDAWPFDDQWAVQFAPWTASAANGNVVEICIRLTSGACGAGAPQDWIAPEGQSLEEGVADATNIQLAEGQSYTACVRVRSDSGAVSTAVCTDGAVVDLTEPSAPSEVVDGQTSVDIDEVVGGTPAVANWTAGGAGGGSAIATYLVCDQPSGTEECAEGVAPVSETSALSGTLPSATIKSNEAREACISARDLAGNESSWNCSDGATGDGIEPVTAASPDWIVSNTSVELEWTPRLNPGDPAATDYQVCVSDSEEAADCETDAPMGWTTVQATTYTASGLNLVDQTSVYVCVRSRDASAATITMVCSGPKSVDGTPPGALSVVDGASGTDVDVSDGVDNVDAHWGAASDSGSGLAGYEYCVRGAAESCATEDWTFAPTNAVSDTVEEPAGSNVVTCARSVDNAGNRSLPDCSDGAALTPNQGEIDFQVTKRTELDLPSSPIVVEDILSDANSTYDSGVAMTSAEADEFASSYSAVAESAEAVVAYGDGHADYGGAKIAYDDGSAVLVVGFTGNLTTHQQELEGIVSSGAEVATTLATTTVDQKEQDIQELQEQHANLAAQGIDVVAINDDPTDEALVASVSTLATVPDPGATADTIEATLNLNAELELTEDNEEPTALAPVNKVTYAGVRKKVPAATGYQLRSNGTAIAVCTTNAYARKVNHWYMITATHCLEDNRPWDRIYAGGLTSGPIVSGKSVMLVTDNTAYFKSPKKYYDISAVKIRTSSHVKHDVFTGFNYSSRSDVTQHIIREYPHVNTNTFYEPKPMTVANSRLCTSGIMYRNYAGGKSVQCAGLRSIQWSGRPSSNKILGYVTYLSACEGDSGGLVYTASPASVEAVGVMSGGDDTVTNSYTGPYAHPMTGDQKTCYPRSVIGPISSWMSKFKPAYVGDPNA